MRRCLLISASVLLVGVGCQRRTFDDFSAGERCEVRFSAGNLGIASTDTKAPAVVGLEAGSTVRVVAYRRAAAGQAAPDLANDLWIATATYKVQADGITLVACEVDDDGKEVAPAAGATVKGMELSNGAYDFYAYSPARKLESDNRTVKGVTHRVDFLGAYVGGKTINRSSSSVELLFEHEAAKVTFSVEPVAAANGGLSCDDLFADSVVMHNIATAPAGDYTVGGDLTPTVGGAADSGVLRTFAYIDAADKGKGAKGSEIFLPKSTGKVPSEFYIKVGTVRYLLKAELPEMAFAKGNDYQFIARVKQGSVDLVLDILAWDDIQIGDDALGGQGATIQIGSWNNIDWKEILGSNPDPVTGTIQVGSWTSYVDNIDFSASNGTGNVGSWDDIKDNTTEN